MFTWIRRQLRWKLFISYLLIILVGVLVLTTAAELAIPSSFDRHIAAMMGETGMGMGMMGDGALGMMGDGSGNDLFTGYRAAVTEALGWAALAAVIAAVGVSAFVSQQVVAPIAAIRQASQRIASGRYAERVRVPGDPTETDELGELAISFNRMAERLDQTENIRRRMIGDVAHELRTPLTTIKGSMEGLIDGVLSPNLETFQDVYKEADRLERLVSDLQELSRVEGGAAQLKKREIDLRETIARTAARMEPQFQEKGVDLQLHLLGDLPGVLGDEDRLTQVLTNLMGNALQYTPAGGRVEIHGSTAPREELKEGILGGLKWGLVEKNWVRVTIKDTGVGIPAEALPHIFDRFFRVDKSRARAVGGSGIGLTIAKHLVEAHGGYIWAESAGPGEGSAFGFILPVVGTTAKT